MDEMTSALQTLQSKLRRQELKQPVHMQDSADAGTVDAVARSPVVPFFDALWSAVVSGVSHATAALSDDDSDSEDEETVFRYVV